MIPYFEIQTTFLCNLLMCLDNCLFQAGLLHCTHKLVAGFMHCTHKLVCMCICITHVYTSCWHACECVHAGAGVAIVHSRGLGRQLGGH